MRVGGLLVAPPSNSQAQRQGRKPRDYSGTCLLQTRRMSLRSLRFADVGELSALHQHEQVRALLLEPVPLSFLENVGLVIQANHVHEERPGLGVWHASTSDSRFVGLFSLMPVTGGDAVELGARLMPDANGRLLSLEGARALRDYAFEVLQLPRLLGFCHPDNHAVPAIFRRLGFSADGETEHFDRPALAFSLQRSSWADARHRARQSNPSTEKNHEY